MNKPMQILGTGALALLVACGGDDGNSNVFLDAPEADSAGASITALASCPATVAAMMTTNASAFSPTSISVAPGSVVKLTATAGHKIIPNQLNNPEPTLNVAQGATKCFQMNTAATYGIQCEFHGFAGTITVTP